MNFTALLEGHSCGCHTKASENYTDTFARKVGDTNDLKARDFKSNYERNKELDSNSCEDICGHRGVSIEIWNEESKVHILQRISLTYEISPMMRRPRCKIGVFRLTNGTGKVRHTPNQQHGVNPYHYDMYKADDFAVEKLSLVEFIPLFDKNV